MIIKIKVKPNSSKQEIVKQLDGSYVIYLREEAKKGKANAELMNLLAKYFNTKVGNVKLRGKTSREKLVEVKK